MSSPYSTEGGGTKFEHEVGALYLAALLKEEIPTRVQGDKVEKIQFQALHTGILIDDIVIILTDGIRQRIVAYQIKHKLTFSKFDNLFKDVIKNYWKTFAGETKFSFLYLLQYLHYNLL